ncbi:beta-1,6-N-acetylglucosaminyltransferase [Paraburkholderia fungorum]|uniref:beta-1,6-N-acetylglucosaminyltransferase n=1 Tax=Paraburkholderia fungorum TaxID=134537 RepID=UPI003877F2EC
MRIAYLLLAHDNPAHLVRLVNRLRSDGTYFFVHVDKKADFRNFFDALGSTVKFCSTRHDCAWGDISLVDATLTLLYAALKENVEFDYFVLLSGSCYPIQPREYIENFFDLNFGKEFIEAFPLPNVEFGKPISRVSRFWFKKNRPFLYFKWRLQEIFHLLPIFRDYERGLLGARPMTGSQWWALSKNAVKYVLEFLRANPKFYEFCMYVDCPDELVFQTILWNSPFMPNMSHSLTYTHWLKGKGGPEILDAVHLAALGSPIVLDSMRNNCPGEKREVLFARKFSANNESLLDDVDRLVERKREVMHLA